MPAGPFQTDVLIIVSSDPRYDARSTKYLRSLLSTGFKAKLVGVASDGSAERTDDLVRVPISHKGGKAFFVQFYQKVIPEAIRTSAKIVIAGDLFSLPPAIINKHRHSHKGRTVRLIYDSKELYDALPSLKVKRTSFLFWNIVEKSSLRYVDSVFTVNQSIADILEARWHLPTTVLRNVPDQLAQRHAASKTFNKIFLTFSGGLQGGRGLHDLLKLISILPPIYEIRFVGDGTMREDLMHQAYELHIQDRVHFVGRVRNENVVEELSKAHIGIYLMENTGLCHYLSLPNKLFQFISSGLPVIVPKFPEMERIVKEFGIGAAVDPSDLNEVAKTVLEITGSTETYEQISLNCEKASEVLNWQVEEKKFLAAITGLV
ncbi:MAG: glycosyltransferase [Bacteroidetes bacterium]|nr:glycosyltransferase [Bacteroidota bacterium]MCL5267829.1 glycosyltransferase [Bacteroidota bacterium]